MADQEYMGGNLTYADDGGDDDGAGQGFDAGGAFDAYGAGLQHGSGVQGMLDEAMAPLRAQVTDMQIERHAESLQSQFPQLTESPTAEAFVSAAAQMAAALGVDFHEVKMNPNFMIAAATAFFGDEQQTQEDAHGDSSIAQQIVRASSSGTWEPDPAVRQARRSMWGI